MTGPAATVQVELATPVGPARAHVDRLRGARGVLVLGHGAGPSITTVDLTAAVAVARSGGWAVALVEQPWLVAGGRVAPRPAVLDQAWLAVVPALVGRGGVLARVPGVTVNGAGAARVPTISNLCFEKTDGEALLIPLDLEGVCVSTGAACASGSLSPSHVLLAMGRTPAQAHGTLRFSLGSGTTAEALARVTGLLEALAPRCREP